MADVIARLKEFLGDTEPLSHLLSGVDTIHRDNEQRAEAIHLANERNNQQDQVWKERFENVLSKYEKSETDRATNDARHHSVQNSIRWATWFAVIAASIYGFISYLQ